MGHVFVVRGDLRRLVCRAWLLPTDAVPTIEPGWTRPLREPTTSATETWFARYVAAVDAERPRPFADDEWVRVLDARSPGGAVPVLTRTAVSDDHVDAAHVARAVREFVRAARAVPAHGPAAQRSVPLLAVPTVGTGKGGGAAVRGEVVGRLLHLLQDVAAEFDVDLAVVTRSQAAAAAMREHRRNDDHATSFDVASEQAEAARALARRVRKGEVVLFTGAGTGLPAGLPTWTGLLDRLDAQGTLADDDLRGLSALDKAAIVQRDLDVDGEGGRERLVAGVVAAVDRDHYAIGHALLANLPVRESATLNYDRLFEIAAADAGRRLAVLPYQRIGPDDAGWLLKLHGCVDPQRRRDIVLTREDYLSVSGHRAALTGLLQAMLVTRHMLFVGFGLGDDHFHAVVHDVRRALAGTDGGPDRPTLGTALVMRPSKASTLVWSRDLTILPMGGDDAARRLEVFLDLLANDSDEGWQHVLDDSYATALDATLAELKRRLDALAALEPVLRNGGAWPAVESMLRVFGYTPPA